MSHKLEYTPSACIGGIAHVSMLPELQDTVKVFYLDMEITKGPEVVEHTDMPMSRFGTAEAHMSEAYAEMEMKAKELATGVTKKSLDIKETDDPYIVIEDHLAKLLIDRMLELSAAHKAEAVENFVTGLDIEYDGDNRKIMTRVLVCSNMLMKSTRRGLATFMIVDPKHISKVLITRKKGLFNAEDSLDYGGLNIFCYEGLGDTVLLGRSTSPEEGSIILATSKDAISGTINDQGDQVDIKYALIEFPNSKNFYLQFDINEHKAAQS